MPAAANKDLVRRLIEEGVNGGGLGVLDEVTSGDGRSAGVGDRCVRLNDG
jgi:hypothetical protein